MNEPHPPMRAWYGGKQSPDAAVVQLIESADEGTEVLFDSAAEEQEGAYGEIVKGLYDKMDSLKRNPTEFRTWTTEDGMETFYEVLLDLAPSQIKERSRILLQLGSFKFRTGADPEEKRKLIAAVFSEPEEDEEPNRVVSSRARRLAAIWSPRTDTLLEYIITRPAQAGRLLSDRLNPARSEPIKLIGHPFAEVRSTLLQPIVEARILAYEQANTIHLLTPVRPVLEKWDQDAEAVGGTTQVNLLETLLLHEVVELVVAETQSDLEPLCAHIVATTFERYLKGTLLNVAVEDFFLEWPPLSSAEEEERRSAELAQQLEETRAFFDEEVSLDEEDEDLDDLPLDTAGSPPRKKKKRKKIAARRGEAAGKKVVRKKKKRRE